MGVLHSFSIKNIFYDKMDFKFFHFLAKNSWRGVMKKRKEGKTFYEKPTVKIGH